MPSVEILRKVRDELSIAFPTLTKDKDIYLSPLVIETPAHRGYELQVVDGGSDYTSALEGGVRREQFNLTIGILRAFAIDSTGYQRFLKDLTRSIFITKEVISNKLEGNFLLVDGIELLTRPLRLLIETPVRRGHTQGCLIKELRFLGGLNTER